MESIFDELEEVETAIAADASMDQAILDAIAVSNRNQIAIGKIVFARFDNVDQALQDLTTLLTPTASGPATTGIIAIDGIASASTGVNQMADTIKDNAAPAKLSVAWADAKGAPADGVTDKWSGDNDAVGTVVDNGDGTATFTPVSVGTVNISVVGANADGTTATATDSVTVTASDAVGGTITLTP